VSRTPGRPNVSERNESTHGGIGIIIILGLRGAM
jgi:hypothetical protein